MTTTTEKTTFDFGRFDNDELENVKAVYLVQERTSTTTEKDCWCFTLDKSIERHDPMDRVGGPYHISSLVEDDLDGKRFFLFCVADCAFPLIDLVRANTFEEGYERYVDFAEEKRHIGIEDSDLGDYGCVKDPEGNWDSENFDGSYTSDGKPVDSSNIQGFEVKLFRIDF